MKPERGCKVLELAKCRFQYDRIMGFSVTGLLDGKPWESTKIIKHSIGPTGRYVKTESRTVYKIYSLSLDPAWRHQLSEKKPDLYKKLVDSGFL